MAAVLVPAIVVEASVMAQAEVIFLVFEKKKHDQRTDGRTDGLMEGQALLMFLSKKGNSGCGRFSL